MYRITILSVCLLATGCTSIQSEQAYYDSVKAQRAEYMKVYREVQDESISFHCESKCDLKYTRPKAMPRFSQIQKPKSNSDIALNWASVLAPTVLGLGGFYFNYKTQDSNNEMNRDIAVSGNQANTSMFENFSQSTEKTYNTQYTDFESVKDFQTTRDYDSSTSTSNTNNTQTVPTVVVEPTKASVTP